MVDSESIGSTISRKRGAWRVDCGFVGAVCGRSDYISLFDHLLEHNDRYAGQLDVAVRTFGAPGLHHSESPGQYDAVREYARDVAANNAIFTIDPLCQLRPDRALSCSGIRRRMAGLRRNHGPRTPLLRGSFDAFPADARSDPGVTVMAAPSAQDVAIGLPLMVSLITILGTIVIHALAVLVIFHFIRRQHQLGLTGLGFWRDVGIVASATLLALTAHLVEITIWG